MAFTAMTLPKNMRFKPPKASDWFAEYAWTAFPESNQPAVPEGGAGMNADLAQVKENRSATANSSSVRGTKSNLKSNRAASANKSVKFDQDQQEGAAAAASVNTKSSQSRPKSAVKGKTGKPLPKSSTTTSKRSKETPS